MNSTDHVVLNEQDVRGMVRLLGEAAALPGGHPEKKRYLMEGLCAMVGADCWAWGLSREVADKQNDVMVSFLKNGFSDAGWVKFLEVLEHPESARLNALVLRDLRENSAQLTRLIQHVIPMEKFYESPAYPLWKAANIGPLFISVRPLGEGAYSTVGFYRRPDIEPFSDRDARIAHIILTEVPWLHERGWPEDHGATVPSLHPRERLALNLLLEGLGRKQIAAHMKIAENTLAGYVRKIYRHFGVNSHAELMRRFFHGDGGDRPF